LKCAGAGLTAAWPAAVGASAVRAATSTPIVVPAVNISRPRTPVTSREYSGIAPDSQQLTADRLPVSLIAKS
jgi:hypothetical protein